MIESFFNLNFWFSHRVREQQFFQRIYNPMALSSNSLLLIDALSKLPLLADRFEDIKLMNVNAVSGAKTGCFSLVFKALDIDSGKHVALKFYDPDPALMHDLYRRNAFQREHGILEVLLTASRCLQLASSLSTFVLSVPLPGGNTVELSCQYFATDWLDYSVEDFFLKQHEFSAVEKLKLFNEIVLAVEALHSKSVFHRDLKADNFRATTDNLKRLVVAIDLGTAARFDSGVIQNSYGQSVGAKGYAAPETHCGLAGNRELAHRTDIYALGCLLFELFNYDYFFQALFLANPHYGVVMAAMGSFTHGILDQQQQLTLWKKAINIHGASVSPIHIDASGNSIPAAVVPFLNELVLAMTHVNFSNRPNSLSWVRAKVWTAIKLLQNDEESRRRILASREQRIRRVEKLRAKEARFAKRLNQRSVP